MFILRALAILAGVGYFGYRAALTGDGASPVLFVVFFTAEIYSLVRFVVETSLVGRVIEPDRTPPTTHNPRADIVLVVGHESESELRAAILGARLARGCEEICVVDQLNRSEIAELCDRLNVERVAGAPGQSLGHSVNAALERGEAPLALLVPADVVILADILETTAGAFDERDVGAVVCRIEAVNTHRIKDHGGYGEEFVRRELMRHRLVDDDVLPWWPAPALVRRSALQSIGGVVEAGGAVTVATGLRLQTRGWTLVDVPVVVGRRAVSPDDDARLRRWARSLHERLAVARNRSGAVAHDRSTALSRRAYRLALFSVANAIQRLVLIALLFLTAFTPWLPLSGDLVVVGGLWTAWMTLSIVARRAAARRAGFVPWLTTDLRLLPTTLVVVFSQVTGRPLQVEPIEPAPGRVGRGVFLTGLQVVLVLLVLTFAVGLVRPVHDTGVVLVVLGAALWLCLAARQARAGLRTAESRQGFRVGREFEVLRCEQELRIVGMSSFGLDVLVPRELNEGTRLSLAFGLPQPDGSNARADVTVTVKRMTARDGHYLGYLQFTMLAEAVMDQIVQYCSATAGLEMLRDTRHAGPTSLSEKRSRDSLAADGLPGSGVADPT